MSGTIRPGKYLSKRCPVGEMSGRGNVRLVSGRGSVQNYPAGGSVLREVPVEEASGRGNVKSGKCSVSMWSGNCPVEKMSGWGKCPVKDMSWYHFDGTHSGIILPIKTRKYTHENILLLYTLSFKSKQL